MFLISYFFPPRLFDLEDLFPLVSHTEILPTAKRSFLELEGPLNLPLVVVQYQIVPYLPLSSLTSMSSLYLSELSRRDWRECFYQITEERDLEALKVFIEQRSDDEIDEILNDLYCDFEVDRDSRDKLKYPWFISHIYFSHYGMEFEDLYSKIKPKIIYKLILAYDDILDYFSEDCQEMVKVIDYLWSKKEFKGCMEFLRRIYDSEKYRKNLYENVMDLIIIKIFKEYDYSLSCYSLKFAPVGKTEYRYFLTLKDKDLMLKEMDWLSVQRRWRCNQGDKEKLAEMFLNPKVKSQILEVWKFYEYRHDDWY